MIVKRCPCGKGIPMLLFDGAGNNEIYTAIGDGLESEHPLAPWINWASWPFRDSPPPNVWVCPRCGYWEEIGPDIQAHQEFRPRLF